MFDYLFVSYENRVDYSYRSIGKDVTKTPSSGVSEPTYYARVSFINEAAVINTLTKAKSFGINLIRVAVEPAIMTASVDYVDSVDGNTYPPDLVMLDTIINRATELGIVIQLQNGNDKAPLSLSLEFVTFLANRYSTNAYVWINPANELNGANGSGNVNNVSVWHSTMSQYVKAIRAAQFLNPIVINPPQFGENLVGVANILNAYAVYNSDPCLFIGVHLYPQPGQYDFRTTRLPAETTNWFQFVNDFCIFVDEVGINNYGTSYDPDLNVGYPSANTDEWVRMKSWTIDFLDWAYQQCNYGNLNGVTGISWYAFIPGMGIVDLNSMIKYDQTRSHWGEIFTSYTSKPDVVITPTPPTAGIWNSYTPVVSSSGGSLGAYTASGRYFSISPNLVFVQIYINISNNGTGFGAINITLPNSMGVVAGGDCVFNGAQIVNDFSLFVRTQIGTRNLRVKKWDGSYPSASGAQLLISGTYGVN